jgi:hypothetical protein
MKLVPAPIVKSKIQGGAKHQKMFYLSNDILTELQEKNAKE